MDLRNSIPILKETNPRVVLGHIRAAGSICRADIARKTGLHPSTITRIVSTLLGAGLVREDGEGSSGLGRKPILLSLVPSAIHVIGVTIESTFVSGVLVNLDAQIMAKVETPLADMHVESVTEKLFYVVDTLLNHCETAGVTVSGIGLAMHGIVDSKAGTSVFAPAIGWKHVPVTPLVNERYGLPVLMDNNANAMALGESWFGNGKGVDNLLAVKVGQSIGSGIMFSGQLFHGTHFSAGEIGHMTVVFDGRRCKCGNYGCLETVASIGAVIKKGRILLKRGDASELLEVVGGNPDHLTFERLCAATVAGDQVVVRLWEEVASYLGLALANTINILNPAKVLIGGDIFPVVDYLLPKTREIVASQVFETSKTNLTIEPVGLGIDSVAIGAATLILKGIFELEPNPLPMV